MPSIDERIKAELERDSARLDEILDDSKGLNAMVFDAFKGGMKGWMWFIASVTGGLGLILIYLIYRFAAASVMQDQLYWGIWSILTLIAVLGFELWSWMQINRVATRREIKQMELALRQVVQED